ncbi:hypothetical protein AcV7_002145 [Taiwanofungus camphoratus]|nr:hypothetical protein AcV7_002145 [Antrodia cinnamomea]
MAESMIEDLGLEQGKERSGRHMIQHLGPRLPNAVLHQHHTDPVDRSGFGLRIPVRTQVPMGEDHRPSTCYERTHFVGFLGLGQRKVESEPSNLVQCHITIVRLVGLPLIGEVPGHPEMTERIAHKQVRLSPQHAGVAYQNEFVSL